MARRGGVPAVTVHAAASAGVVDVLTGVAPVVPPLPAGQLGEADARALTDRIRATARDIADRVARLRVLVDQAREGLAWATLGYASWTDYLADTLEPMRLPRAERREIVGYLSGEGMSTRAIAPIVSVDPKTVVNDRRAIERDGGVESSTPATEVITGRDGRQYPARPPVVARTKLVVVPPDRSSADVRRVAAQMLRTARRVDADRATSRRVGAFHMCVVLERARDIAACEVADFVALGADESARATAAAYVLLRDLAVTTYDRTCERERARHGIARSSTLAG